MNKKCRVIEKSEYMLIVETIRSGFFYNGIQVQPNVRIATALVAEANTGMRIGDILRLRLTDIVYEAGRYHLDIVEQKTGKKRTFTIAPEIVNFLQSYALEQGIRPNAKLFDITERAVQKHLHTTTHYLGIEGASTHSFRKFFASQIYQNNHHNIELVRELLQHSSVAISQKYLGVSSQLVEQALREHVYIP